mmetsp:Transcript_28931/g.67163  ORF Transcript_28931/g.67163 Transcript_28931/m.67163 type:complete len:109 (-) Transcript_28931:542-868(-)
MGEEMLDVCGAEAPSSTPGDPDACGILLVLSPPPPRAGKSDSHGTGGAVLSPGRSDAWGFDATSTASKVLAVLEDSWGEVPWPFDVVASLEAIFFVGVSSVDRDGNSS